MEWITGPRLSKAPSRRLRERQGRRPDSTWGPAATWGQAVAADWTLEEVRRFLADYGREPARLAAAPLPGGWENLNLSLDAGGERFVLRRYDSTDPAEVPWEMELLRFLNHHRFPTAALIPRSDGALLGRFTGRPAALFAFVEGRHPHWNEPAAATAAAEVIADLHRVTAELRLLYPRTRTDVRARIERFCSWVAARDPAAEDGPLHRLAGEVARYWAEFLARLAAVESTTGALPRGIVHTDAHGNNLLFDASGRLVALLDFDDAHEGLLLRDVCMLIDTWGVERAAYRFEFDRARPVLTAYTARRPLTASERELLPDALVLFNLAETTGYVTGRVQSGAPAAVAIADCNQYARFRERTGSPSWRAHVRDALL